MTRALGRSIVELLLLVCVGCLCGSLAAGQDVPAECAPITRGGVTWSPCLAPAEQDAPVYGPFEVGPPPPEDYQDLIRRLRELEERVARDERIAIGTIKCFNRTLLGGGCDLLSTGWAWQRCPTCRENNPLGVNADARIGLKMAQISITGSLCYILLKTGHEKAAKIVSWSSLGIQLGVTASNGVHIVRGR